MLYTVSVGVFILTSLMHIKLTYTSMCVQFWIESGAKVHAVLPIPLRINSDQVVVLVFQDRVDLSQKSLPEN